jgi:hypothetical protein
VQREEVHQKTHQKVVYLAQERWKEGQEVLQISLQLRDFQIAQQTAL